MESTCRIGSFPAVGLEAPKPSLRLPAALLVSVALHAGLIVFVGPAGNLSWRSAAPLTVSFLAARDGPEAEHALQEHASALVTTQDARPADPGKASAGGARQLAGWSPRFERYYSAGEVDTRAQPVSLKLQPLEGPQAKREWRAVFQLWIGDAGRVDAVKVLSETAETPREIVEALRNTEFRPAFIAGRPVKSIKTIELSQ